MPKGAEEGALATEEAGLAVRRIPTLITYLKAEPSIQAASSSTAHWQRHDQLNLWIYKSITKSAIHDVQS